MAATLAGTRLTAEHRSAQLALRAITLRQVLQVWPAFDTEHAGRSWPPVENALLAIIGQRRADSTSLAAGYFEAFRAAERIGGTATPILSAFDAEAMARARTSLQVTGYVTTERLTALKRPAPSRTALVRVSGAVTRHVLDGGRETLLASVRDDPRALGWERVTSAEPCNFCAMLASRGAVYAATTGTFQSHDHCGCVLEPKFGRR
ncbi:MAG: hypothetical protein IT299_11195 [Dehalococcoidia bacterium]|nr:hypothetical protein [Dehalococcoidia bacterium]